MTDHQPVKQPTYPNRLNYFILLCLVALLGTTIFFGIRLNQASIKLSLMEQRTQQDHQQLTKFNQILGQSLDNQEPSNNFSNMDEKISLEMFDKISSLLLQVNTLDMQPSTQMVHAQIPAVAQEPSIKTSANPEMRWWGKVGHLVFLPVQSFFSNLVKIQVLDMPVNELAMTVNSQKLLREEIMLRIFTARGLALHGLLHQTATELTQVKRLIELNCASQSKGTQVFLADLQIVLSDLEEIEKKQTQKNLAENKPS